VRQPEWYCDADVRGLGKTLAGMRLPVTWPGDDGERASERLRQPPSPIEDAATADELWIPAVTKAGLVIVTRDSKIMDRVGEINAVIASRARMFVITSHNQLDLWDEVRIVAAQWSTMINGDVRCPRVPPGTEPSNGSDKRPNNPSGWYV